MSEQRNISPTILISIVSVVVVLAAAILATVFLRSSPPTVETPRTTPSPRETPEATPGPELGADAAKDATPIVLPPLADSDPLIRRLVGEMSQHPDAVARLVPESAVERFVAAVDNVAAGASPRVNVKQLAPSGAYQAIPLDGDTFEVAPDSYARYDPIVAVVTSVEPRAAARVYHQLKPLMEEAYRNLGYPKGGFDATLTKAIGHLLATPVPEQPVKLVSGLGTYRYADPELEALTPARKHLVRMGPANQRRMQAHIRAIAAALGIATP